MVLVMHNLFMYLTTSPKYNNFLFGVSAAVVGLISESACQLTKAAVHNGMDTLVFTCTLLTLTQSTNKYAPLLIIFAAAMAGQVLYRNNANTISS
jgi:chromate transport protein ChrA